MVGALLGLVAACGAPKEPVDTILHGGHIVTLDPSRPEAEAIAIRGEEIVAVGDDEDVLAYDARERIDLGGRTVLPGFTDNHYHSIGGGPGVDLSGARSLADVHEAISRRASQTPAGDVIRTNSDWHEGQLEEQRLPYRDDLDEAAPDHPVVVVRGGHEYILNSRALAKWGIDESVASPAGGSVGRYPTGRLNGELVDTAKAMVDLPPVPPPSDPVAALRDELRALHRVGLTSIRYGATTPELYERLKTLAGRGELPLRVSALLRLPRGTAPPEIEETMARLGIAPGEGDEWLRFAGIKLGVDGGFEGGLLREPYEEPWGAGGEYRGLQTMPTEDFVATVRELNRLGYRVGTHAVGDAAIDLVLDGYERAHADESIAGERWAIEHGFLPTDDHYPRMRALGLHVTAQHHLYLAAPSLSKYWGPERASRVTPLREYLDEGIPTSLGTDSPVVPYPPLWVLYHFVTRDTISAGVMGEDQRVERIEAFDAMSRGYAELTFEEERKGMLREGRLADLVVVEDDLLTCAAERIRDTTVLLTMVGGRVVHRHETYP